MHQMQNTNAHPPAARSLFSPCIRWLKGVMGVPVTPPSQAAASARQSPFLTRLRKRLRHAWLLHFTLVFAMLILPAGRIARADGEDGGGDGGDGGDGFDSYVTESSVMVNVSVVGGTAGMQPGESRQLAVSVVYSSWEVWTKPANPANPANPAGAVTEIRNSQSNPVQGAGLTFNATGDEAMVSNTSGSTDSSGNAGATFTLGTQASVVTVTVAGYDASSSVSFGAPILPETWTFYRPEELLSASLVATGSAGDVAGGDTRAVQVHVDYSTWGVYVSNKGNRKTDDYHVSPAIGAQIGWSVVNGDGSVINDGSTFTTDGSGNVSTTFTMGDVASIVRADVNYLGTNTTYAT